MEEESGLSVWSKITRVEGEKKREGHETPPRGQGLNQEPETHQKFVRELFQPVSHKSLKLIPVREGIKVYVL